MDKIPDRYEDLPPTPAEQMEAVNRLVTKENDRRERLRRARDNRRRGHEEPREGAVMFVSLDRTIEARRRAGVRFERGHRAKVLVIDASDADIAKILESGNLPEGADGVVNIDGAEQILADDALVVHQSAAGAEDALQLRRENEALATEAARLREEIASLRSARMGAGPSTHGEPSRLNAAREAAAKASKADKASDKTEEFGGDPAKR